MKDHLDPDQGTKLEVLNPTHEDLLGALLQLLKPALLMI